MTTKRIHLTDAVIKSLRKPNKGRDYYNDDREGGLQLQVTKNGYKTFYLCKFYCGKCKRFLIGKSDEITVSQARIRAAEQKLNLSKGIGVKNETTSVVIPNEEMSFLSAFELYLRDRKDISPKTLKNYKSMWKKIEPRFGGMKLSMIDDNSIREFHSYLSLNTGKCQANRVLTLMKAIFNFLIRRGFYKKNNPAILVSPNKEKHRARVLTDEELPRFFNSVNELKNTTVRDAILLLLYTGARKSNVMEMRWNDIDLVGKIWSIPMTKSGKSLRLPLAEKAVEILEDRKKTSANNSQWVFESPKSASTHIIDIKKSWKRVLEKANIFDFHIHDLRHTLATALIANGASTAMVMRLLGHATLAAAQRYMNLSVEDVRDVVNGAATTLTSKGQM